MPIHHSLWKVGDKPIPLLPAQLAAERDLEEMIVRDPNILSSEWMLIGRQEATKHGGRIDLLAIAPDASLVLIELKRNRTPREIIAQAVDYASWVEQLEPEAIAEIYRRFSNGGTLDAAFKERFRTALDEDSLNSSHQIIIVAAELDDSTERIVGYLNARDIAINVVFFKVFQNGDDQLLSRAWLIDPTETQENAATSRRGKRQPWNGEYYVSFGGRDWEDARRYGFISAGGGVWYSRTLSMLSPGDRIWVKIPQTGYVGVGRVVESVVPANEFIIQTPEGPKSCFDVLKAGETYRARANDVEMSEYFVRVDWLDTVSETDAVNELGLLGNQNSVCRPVTPQWRHTVERLKSHFPGWDA
jgi:hypothetical protein